ncbi:phosphotransferase [Ligilactobacillus agilis]|uniref:phosphotransferase n=1 Tax=Ligilactobacillus agilis TaxID=1601 RepID=UPI00195D0CA1|nr:phosphotransferase [Ligilactobacillus agilis]MBM6763552.1 phosphotransferase [Ligilactobacillus agilis]
MNKKEAAIIRYLKNNSSKVTQRKIAEDVGLSLGSVNNTVKKLVANKILDEELSILDDSMFEKPKRAIILAAGYGMRMVPINTEYPKGLLKVKGQPLIERLIKQLHMVGVHDIKVVVGFMKEQYEYLIDDFGVELIVNQHYSDRKNLYSLNLACQQQSLEKTYIVPCDIYAKENPFKKEEISSWYMVTNQLTKNSDVKVSRNFDLKTIRTAEIGNKMIGIAYVSKVDGKYYTNRLQDFVESSEHDKEYWETILNHSGTYQVLANIMSVDKVYEINTYEELRNLDSNSNQLNNDTISLLSEILNVNSNSIKDITVLKKGMTNRSFLFSCEDKKYIMRIPGEGSNELIDRQKEAKIYELLGKEKITENVLYINPDNGYKLTEFVAGARNCNIDNNSDLEKCMETLRKFHSLKLKADFEFNLYKQIDFYEKLRGANSNYRDYDFVKERVLGLKDYIDTLTKDYILCHIDANPDNFLIDKAGNVMLIDWEYAAMQDPDVDIAMFAIYAMYDRRQTDNLINIYYQNQCDDETRTKIYAYMAICGLLWSNWCEYKNSLGVDFGEYSLKQYRYAKEYSKLVYEILEGKENE